MLSIFTKISRFGGKFVDCFLRLNANPSRSLAMNLSKLVVLSYFGLETLHPKSFCCFADIEFMFESHALRAGGINIVLNDLLYN